ELALGEPLDRLLDVAQGLLLPRRVLAAPHGPAKARVALRDRPRVEAWAEEPAHRLAVVADGDRAELARPVLAVEPPVRAELPGGEAEEAGQKSDGGAGHRGAGDHADDGRERAADRADEGRIDRRHDLPGDGDDGEVLDRVQRRLDEEVEVDAEDV